MFPPLSLSTSAPTLHILQCPFTLFDRPSSSRRTFFAAGPSLPPGKEARRPSSDCCSPFRRLSCTLIQSLSCSTVMRTLSGSSIVVAPVRDGDNMDGQISLSVVAMFTRVEDVTESNFMATDFKAQMNSHLAGSKWPSFAALTCWIVCL